MLAHNVYFTLKDTSPEAVTRLVEACKRYLPIHSGVVFFAAGGLAAELDREVNDRDWQVGLHIIFESTKAQDDYQVSRLHEQFIAENKDNWAKVRVFDSLVESVPPKS